MLRASFFCLLWSLDVLIGIFHNWAITRRKAGYVLDSHWVFDRRFWITCVRTRLDDMFERTGQSEQGSRKYSFNELTIDPAYETKHYQLLKGNLILS